MLLSKDFDGCPIKNLHEGRLVDPHSLDNHLAKLHAEDEGLKVTQRRYDVNKSMSQLDTNGQHQLEFSQQFRSNLDSVKMKQKQPMGFVDRFFIHTYQVLVNNLLFSGFVLEVTQLFSLRNKLNDVFQLHILVDSLNVGC